MSRVRLFGLACIDGLHNARAIRQIAYFANACFRKCFQGGILMFQRILVPVDLTAKSLAAVDLAYDFAKQSKAEVILLHVIETIEHVQFDDLKPFYDRLENSARKGLREFCERFVMEKMKV